MNASAGVHAANVESAARPLHERALFASTLLLIGMAAFTGGGSQDRQAGDAATQLVAWAVLLLATWRLTIPGVERARSWLLMALAALPVAVALQRVTGLTLTPWATERAIWELVPALAAFAAALSLPRRDLAMLAWAIVGLATFSLMLGYLQLGAPQDSSLNPFPEWAPALNGLYANPNHQATSIAVALIIVLSWLLHRDEAGLRHDGRWWASRVAASGMALFLLVGLPLTGSRAAVLIAAATMLAVPVVNGWLGRRLRHGSWGALAALVAGGLLAGLLLVSASAWLKVDQEQESRTAIFAATTRMATDALPAGTGTGSFVPYFAAHTPDMQVRHSYLNHAHNEYLQWWLEGGIGGIAWTMLLLAFVAWARPRWGSGRRPAWLAVASWLSLVVVLAHSTVDYPMRTPALLTITALLAGIAASCRLAATERAQAP